MSDNQEDTSPLEYFIAGLVVLSFGLLYFLINHGLEPVSGSGREYARGSLPAASSEVTAPDKALAVIDDNEIQPVDKTAKQSVTAKPFSKKEDLRAATSEKVPKDGVRQLLAAETGHEMPKVEPSPAVEDLSKQLDAERLRAAAAERKLRETEALLAAERAAREKQEAEIALITQPEPEQVEGVEQEEKEDNNTQQTLFNLPDGTEVRITDEGFEGTVKMAMMASKLNDPMLFDGISFQSGSSQLATGSEQQISAVAALMNTYPSARVLIRGHTDNTGNVNANSLLSLTRSDSMKKSLVALGIDQERIRIEGVGPLEPLASNDTEAGRRKNRRIELLLID